MIFQHCCFEIYAGGGASEGVINSAREPVFRGERRLSSLDRSVPMDGVCPAVLSFRDRKEDITMNKNSKTNIRKLAAAALLTAVAVVGSLFSFPFLGAKCSPVQHLVNIIGGVYLGPWYAMGSAFCASLIRLLLGLGSPLAFPGSMVGALLSGAMYHMILKHKGQWVRLIGAYIGELFGTSVIGGMLSFPIAYFVMENTAATLFGFVFPFFVSSVVGTVAASIIVSSMKKARLLEIFDDEEKAKN